MKKIAFYVGNLARGGAQRVLVNLANYFHGEHYQVLLVTAKWEEGEYPYDEGIHRILSDLTQEERRGNRAADFWARLGKLRAIWKRERPDIIISFMGKSNLNAIVSAAGLSIPVLVSVRSDPYREYATPLRRALARTLFRRAAGVVLQTDDSASFFPKAVQKKCVILPNSLDPRFIRERFTGERQKEIVSVGSLDANKNNGLLIRAFARIADDYPDWRVIFYGDGCARPKLEQFAAEFRLKERVVFAGKEPEIYRKIWNAGVYVLTSNAEGMPNALLEAMALGLAVISTDCPCGGPKTLIEHEKNGILIPVGDADALAAALKKVLDDSAFAQRLGRNAHKLSVSHAPEKVNRMWRDYVESKMVN